MKTTTLTGLLYAILVPVQVWTGYELGTGRYNNAAVLVVVMMVIEAFTVRLWITAQTEEVRNLNTQHS